MVRTWNCWLNSLLNHPLIHIVFQQVSTIFIPITSIIKPLGAFTRLFFPYLSWELLIVINEENTTHTHLRIAPEKFKCIDERTTLIKTKQNETTKMWTQNKNEIHKRCTVASLSFCQPKSEGQKSIQTFTFFGRNVTENGWINNDIQRNAISRSLKLNRTSLPLLMLVAFITILSGCSFFSLSFALCLSLSLSSWRWLFRLSTLWQQRS